MKFMSFLGLNRDNCDKFVKFLILSILQFQNEKILERYFRTCLISTDQNLMNVFQNISFFEKNF